MWNFKKILGGLAFVTGLGFCALHAQPAAINTIRNDVGTTLSSALQQASYSQRTQAMFNYLNTDWSFFTFRSFDQQAIILTLLELFNQRSKDPANPYLGNALNAAKTSGLITNTHSDDVIQEQQGFSWVTVFDPKVAWQAALDILIAAIGTADTYTPQQLAQGAGFDTLPDGTPILNTTLIAEIRANADYGISLETPETIPDKPAVEGYSHAWNAGTGEWVATPVYKTPAEGVKHTWDATNEQWIQSQVQKPAPAEGVRITWDATNEQWAQTQIQKPSPQVGYKITWKADTEQWLKSEVQRKSFVGYTSKWDPATEDYVADQPVTRPTLPGYKTEWDPNNDNWIQGAAVPPLQPVQGSKRQWNTTLEEWELVPVPLPAGKTQAEVQWNAGTESWDVVGAPPKPAGEQGSKWVLQNNQWVKTPVTPPQPVVGKKTTWDAANEQWVQNNVPLPAGKTQADVEWDAAVEGWKIKAVTTTTQTTTAAQTTTTTQTAPQTQVTTTAAAPTTTRRVLTGRARALEALRKPTAITQTTQVAPQRVAVARPAPQISRQALSQKLQQAKIERRLGKKIEKTLALAKQAKGNKVDTQTQNEFSRVLMNLYNKRGKTKKDKKKLNKLLTESVEGNLLADNQKKFVEKKMLKMKKIGKKRRAKINQILTSNKASQKEVTMLNKMLQRGKTTREERREMKKIYKRIFGKKKKQKKKQKKAQPAQPQRRTFLSR